MFLDGDYTQRKRYKHVYMYSKGDITLTAYIDGKVVGTKRFTDTDNNLLKVKAENQDGYSIHFKIEGAGEVLGLNYDPVAV